MLVGDALVLLAGGLGEAVLLAEGLEPVVVAEAQAEGVAQAASV
jgi:hypothetical protein